MLTIYKKINSNNNKKQNTVFPNNKIRGQSYEENIDFFGGS